MSTSVDQPETTVTPSAAAANAAGLAPPAELLRTVIEPASGWQLLNVRELWKYRELFGFLILRDVKVRYKQTLLGAAWAVLQPAMMMIVFTIFFGRMANVSTGDVPYPLFVYAGLLPWTFFATAIASAGNSVVGSERLITKIYFPRLIIPFASVGAAAVDFCVALLLMLGLMVWYQVAPGVGLLVVPVIMLLIAIAALGIGTLLAALNVAYRDFRYVIPFLLQLWMFATPTIYLVPDTAGSGWFQFALMANPLTSLVEGFRAAVLDEPLPWSQMGISTLTILAMFLLGCFYFRKVEDSFADII